MQEWQDEDTSIVIAMYPLSEVQYLECRFVYDEASAREEIRQIMHSLTVMP